MVVPLKRLSGFYIIRYYGHRIMVATKAKEIVVFTSKAEGIVFGIVYVWQDQILATTSRQKILEILSPLEPPKRHQYIQAKRCAGPVPGYYNVSGSSFGAIEHKQVKKSMLCCYGMSGAGKAIIRFENQSL